ncbi:hypothetical protein ACWCP6_28755 [Streptomyces sp. NPDC002004]
MYPLEELAERVIRDLSIGITVKPLITFINSEEGDFVDILVRDEAGIGIGFRVDSSEAEERILYEMAYRIPDAYVELYAVGLPVVPGTERPAVPRIAANTVLWEDPGASGWSCQVGEYRHTLENPHDGRE